ncbi:MAG: translation initiation factor IF-2 N-terminal domain-containing protein, partial [bacterium]
MSMVRVDELAQEFGMNPEALFSQLKAMGFDVVNVTSSVDRKLIDMVSDMLAGAPKEREETSRRRIVSVRKGERGETTPEVEVRLEEELPAGEEEPGPEEAVQEAAVESVVAEVEAVEEILPEVPEPAVEAVPEQVQELPVTEEPPPAPQPGVKNKRQIPLTTLE